MASQMDTMYDHNCEMETKREMQLHSILQKDPVENAIMMLYCDGHRHYLLQASW